MMWMNRKGAALILMTARLGAQAQEGSIDPTFDPTNQGFGYGGGANYVIYATLLRPDGSLLIGGDLYYYNNNASYRIVKLTSDGQFDPSLAVPLGGLNNSNYAIAEQPDGKIIVAGRFTSYAGTARNHIARLNANGSIDTGFDPGIGTNDDIWSVALQSDGKILIGGDFNTYNGSGRNRIARLNADGSLDLSFNPGTGANSRVRSIVMQADKIIIGGSFYNFNGVSKSGIARLNVDGSLDGTFQGNGTVGDVRCITMQGDGDLIVSGNFSTISGMARQGIARLEANGAVDTGFDPLAGTSEIYGQAVQPDGKIIIVGWFSSYNGIARTRIARVNSDGSLDTSFDPGAGADLEVHTAVVQPDGKIIIAGRFTTINNAFRYRITRLNSNGSLDATFNPASGPNSTVDRVAVQADNKVVICGGFLSYKDSVRASVARLNVDGSVDPTFNPGTGANNFADALLIQPDGKIIIAGAFTSYNGTSRIRIARLNTNGSLDTGFDPGSGANQQIYCCALQPDGKIIIAGSFTMYNGTTRIGVARLNGDGSLDLSFDPGTGANGFDAIAIQADGKVIAGGAFTSFNGTACGNLIRLNTNGSVDTGFLQGTGSNHWLQSIAIRPDGKILIGGLFSSYNGTSRNRIARLNSNGSLDTGFNPGGGGNGSINALTLQPDGKILIGGYFSTYNGVSRPCLARMNASGSLDNGFVVGTGANSTIYDIAVGPDGKVLVGGGFTSYGGVGRNYLMRLNSTPQANIKLLLEGPNVGGTMNDALRTLPSFPLADPFSAMGYAETDYVSGATIAANVLTNTGNNAIVDWVIVEMRAVSTPGTVAASRAVLLQRDGDVVDLDGVSTVGFAGLAAGNYCVAVKPRNHLPVMLSATTPLSYGSAIATVDFTLPTTQVYDNDARKNVSGVMVLAAGDVTFNESVQYTGSGNDRDPILTRVGSTTPNAVVPGYWREDVNMDGVVKYTGSANDRDIILTNVGSTTPNNTRVATLP
jgi:uncharacterized delta-60 repeat protein